MNEEIKMLDEMCFKNKEEVLALAEKVKENFALTSMLYSMAGSLTLGWVVTHSMAEHVNEFTMKLKGLLSKMDDPMLDNDNFGSN